MRKILLFISILSITSCNSSSEAGNKTQPEDKRPPSAISDARLSGYYGAVKIVEVYYKNIAAYTANDEWIIKDSSDERRIYHFDTLGNEIEEQIYTKKNNSWELVDDRLTTRQKDAKIKKGNLFNRYPHYTYSVFHTPNTEVTKEYYTVNNDTTQVYERRLTYHDNYGLLRMEERGFDEDTAWKISQFKIMGDTTLCTTYSLNGSTDTTRETIIVLEKDKKGNRTKIIAINDKTGNAEITLRSYEYYPPRK